MATEMSSRRTPETHKKKKNRDQTDNSVKKRKRPEEQQQNGETVAEPVAKKSKKRKSKDGEDSRAELNAESGVAVAPPPESDENERKEPQTLGESIAESPAPDKLDEKKKKRKKKTLPEASAEATEAIADTIPARKHKRKKDHQSTVTAVEVASREEAPSANVVADDILESHSPFVQQTTSFYLALSPCAQDFPLKGLCAEHISPLLLTYYPPLKGVVISYSNPRLSEHPDDAQRPQTSSSADSKTILTKSIDEYAVTYVWLSAEFVLFRPSKGTWLEGYVNLQNESMLGLVCYNYFNAGIDRTQLPKEWRWVGNEGEEGKGKKAMKEGEGCWVNSDGHKVEGRVVFRVRDFEATPGSELGAGSINISGTILSEKLDEERRAAQR